MTDIVDLMLGTGARIGETLAIRWPDLNLGAAIPTATICGTLQQQKGRPIFRQDWTKSTAGYRVVILPRFAVDMLMRRLVNSPANNMHGAVFCTSRGTWLSPNNVRRSWRQIRKETDFEWVTPHTFRKTVATLIDIELGSKSAAAQLGHASESTTKKHYVAKPARGPDVSRILQRFAGMDSHVAEIAELFEPDSGELNEDGWDR